MLFARKSPPVLLLFTFLLTSVGAQSYKDDSLAVVKILAANGLDTVNVADVSAITNGRISLIDLENMGLRVLPECIGKLDSLTSLDISYNNLIKLPDSIGSLSKLEYLSCYDNNIYELPNSFSQLRNLKAVYLIRNRLTRWPDVFYSMPNLEMIDLGGNHLTNIPDSISRCTTVKELYINDNYILQLPESITKLDLEVVHVSGNAICNTSAAIENWLGLHDYYKENAMWRTYQYCDYFSSDTSKIRDLLDKNGWTDIPVDSVVTVENGNIIGIDISYEKRTTLKSLSKKSTVSAQKMVLSSGIEYLRHLRSLNLSGNNIDTLPDWFGNLCHLEKLNLSNNHLTTLPDFMAAFRNLDTLNLAGNQINIVSVIAGKWADIYAPGWRSTQSVTGTLPEFDKKRTVSRMITAVSSSRKAAFQVRFDKQITAEIALYSISGRFTTLLAKKHFMPGIYDFYPGNSYLPNGIYIVTVKSGSKVLDAMKLPSK